jgi:WD40 repeat protein
MCPWIEGLHRRPKCAMAVNMNVNINMKQLRELIYELFRPRHEGFELEGFRYRAFLSYRTLDRKQAEWLHRKLERYRVPRALVGKPGELGLVPGKIGRVFLDRDEARTEKSIKEIIAKELSRSQQLIVLCTPRAVEPASWVGLEIEIFRKSRPDGRIHAVIGDGEPPGCFPRQLGEPLAADLRPRKKGGQDGVARAVVKLIAGLIGVNFDDLWKRERRRAQAQRAAIVSGGLVIALFAAGTWVFLDRTTQAQEKRNLVSEMQAAIDNQQYERAIRIGLLGIPTSGQVPWSLGWSDQSVQQLEAKLVGAAQLSSLVAQFQEGDSRDRATFIYSEFSPDGKRVVTAAENGNATIWDIITRKRVVLCEEAKVVPPGYLRRFSNLDWIWSSRFSHDGNRVISASHDGVAWIWTAKEASCMGTPLLPPHMGPVRSAAFNRDDELAITGSEDGTTRLWRTKDATPLGEPRQWEHGKITSVDFSARGDIIASSADGYAWILTKGGTVNTLQTGGPAIWSASFSKDGGRAITGSMDGSIVMYDLMTNEKKRFPPQQNSVNSVAFSSDGQKVVTASADKTVRLWDIRDPDRVKLVFVFKGHSQTESVRHAEFSPLADKIVSASSDRTVRIWDADSNIPIIYQAHGAKPIRSVELARGGTRFVTVGDDGSAIVWELGPDRSARQLYRLTWPEHGGIVSAASGENPDRIIYASLDGSSRLWDANDGILWETASSLQGQPSAPWSPIGAASTRISPDNRIVLTSKLDEGVTAWRIDAGNSHWRLEGAERVSSVEFDSDGSQAVTASENGFAELWDVRSGARRFRLTPPHRGRVTSAHFNSDGTKVITAAIDRSVRIWDAKAGSLLFALPDHGGDVYGARFSSDGNRIITASGDRTVRIWDARSGTEMLRFPVAGDPFDATFSRDGNYAIAALFDGTLEVFDVQWTGKHDEELFRDICNKKLPGSIQLFTADDAQGDIFLRQFVGRNTCGRTQ